MKLRIASYNIHKGVLGVRRPRLTIHELRRHLQLLEADIVFLQEVQGRHDRHQNRFLNWPDHSQHEFLAQGDDEVQRLLGHAAKQYFSVYGMNAVYPHGHHGNALLSAHPIEWSINEDISDHRMEQRGLLHACVQSDQGPIHCLVAHFGLFGGGRKRQADRLVEHVARHVPANAPLIVAGDFNDWMRRLGGRISEGLGATEVLLDRVRGRRLPKAASFPSRMPVLGLDRVFVRGLKVESARIHYGAPWAALSDHAPFVVDLQMQAATERGGLAG